MSSIIDDLVFYREKHVRNDSNEEESIWSTLEQLSKSFSINQGAILLNSNIKNYETLNKLKHQNHEYSTRFKAQANLRSVRVEVRLLQENQFQKISSKHNEILLLKEVAKRQFQANCEYPFCIVKGCVIMVQKMYFYAFDSTLKKKAIEFYNSIFTKIFKHFEDFVNQQSNLIYKVPSNIKNSDENINEDLFLIQSLCTSSISFDVWEETSKFEQIVQANNRQQKELKNIIDNLQEANTVQQITNKLFWKVNNNLETLWIKENFEAKFYLKFKLYAKLLGIAKFIGEKKIDDFIFNMVKVKIKEVVARPFGEGGSCQLFLAKAEITFINSVDNTSYFKNQDKKQKVIAIKKIKPELQSKMKCKLDHQKSIVSKLKGGVSYFIPKYYRVEAQLENGNSLLMEYIQGQELDYFIACRQETISLCTKLCILLNVVHGMRHLATYSITHLDLKPINILVSRNNYLISKIIDFGQAHHPQVCSPNYCPGYTFPYVAPEVYNHTNSKNQDHQQNSKLLFSEKQDVFAFGFIMYEIVFNNKMFQFTPQKYHQIYSKKQILQRVLCAFERLEDYGQQTAMSLLTHLIIRCLDPDPQKRPRFDWVGISLRIILNTCSGIA